MTVMVVLVALLGIAVLALSFRLWKLRQGGTAAIMRDIPAVGGHGWRHGVIPYRGADAAYYRLSSVRPWPDSRLNRRGVEVVSRRPPRGDEFDIMTEEIIVLELRDTTRTEERAMKSRWTAAHSRPSSRGWNHVPRHAHVVAAPDPVAISPAVRRRVAKARRRPG